MTAELLEKGNNLKNEIDNLELSLNRIISHEGRNSYSRFIVGNVYEVSIPEEVTGKLEMLAKIELSSLLAEKRKQFEELGKTEH